jgi:2-methylaconitate cis-trans-isomerase PrpF
MTGSLCPIGNRKYTLTIPSSAGTPQFTVTASLVDAANPFIFVDSATLPSTYDKLGPSAPETLTLIESIRREGAVKFGLAVDAAAASLVRGTPKIAVLSPPGELRNKHETEYENDYEDIAVTAYSMGKVYPTLQLTGAVCLGAAVCVEGTVAHDLSDMWRYLTPLGTPHSETVR